MVEWHLLHTWSQTSDDLTHITSINLKAAICVLTLDFTQRRYKCLNRLETCVWCVLDSLCYRFICEGKQEENEMIWKSESLVCVRLWFETLTEHHIFSICIKRCFFLKNEIVNELFVIQVLEKTDGGMGTWSSGWLVCSCACSHEELKPSVSLNSVSLTQQFWESHPQQTRLTQSDTSDTQNIQ